MDLDDQDDLFGDDDLDDLPPASLSHLEHQARLSTQAKAGAVQAGVQGQQHASKHYDSRPSGVQPPKNAPSSDYGFDADEDVIDLDAQPSFVQQHFSTAQPRQADEMTMREQWRQDRYAQPVHGSKQQSVAGRTQPDPQQPYQRQTPTTRPLVIVRHADGPGQNENEVNNDGGMDVSALQLRIQELERTTQSLQKAAEDAKSAAFSKSGEIAIVRANQQKEAQEYERKMKVIQQQHADEVARSKANLDAMKKEREKYETSNRFLEHDLARETERAKVGRRTLKDGHGNTNRGKPSPLSTPRKNKAMPLRDGFDDAEVAVVSPSKSKEKGRAPSTPKAGAKRKRSRQDEHAASSPSLSFSAADPMGETESGVPTPKQLPHPRSPMPKAPARDPRLELMQNIMDHYTPDGRDRTLEALTKFYFPSKPNSSLASVMYDCFTHSRLDQTLDNFRHQVCDVLLSQWKSCLDEKYYDPLYDITELLQYILVISSISLTNQLLSRITPQCQSTVDLVTVTTAKALIDPSKNPLPTRTLKSKVNTNHYLDMLHFVAVHAAFVNSDSTDASLEDSKNFWSHMEFDFVLTLLHRAQPLTQIVSMLDLLHHSVLEATFGSIYPDPTRQKQMESNLIDRLTKLLFEDPQHPRPTPRVEQFLDFLYKDEIEAEEIERGALPIPDPYSLLDILGLRSKVLGLLYDLALNQHGGNLLATHHLAIGRFVRFLHESVVKMYVSYDGWSPSEHNGRDAGDGADAPVSPKADVTDGPYALHAQHINTVTTILYHLNSTYGNLVSSSQESQQKPSTNVQPVLNIHAYLDSQPAASQAYLVALSRIAFSETMGLEVGIDPEVAEMAHEMLDEFVSPEDGEGVLGVFESGRVSGA